MKLISLFSGGWRTLSSHDLTYLSLSGLIGIFIGDTALFSCMNRMGPRRTNLLFTCNTIFTPILGILIFQEQITSYQIGGASLLLVGVALAIMFGKNQKSQRESIRGPLSITIALGLISAFGQSLDSVLAKPAIHGGTDAVAASLIRMLSALIAHLLLWWSVPSLTRSQQPINWSNFGYVFTNGFLAWRSE